jgi:predicted AlkP superfamily phosphohydrolase/phosphomutase
MSQQTKRHAVPRVLVIGLDSADAELIEQWCAAGYLPTLASLRQQGMWGRLGTTAEVMHVSAWPSLYTGTRPGKHGMYHAYQISAGEQDVHRTRADECALPPFWTFLDAAGRRCIVMDAFMSSPLDGFRGIQILEYGTWTWFDEPMAAPNGIWHDIIRQFGPYPVPEHTRVLTRPEPARFHEQLLAGAAVKSKVVRWLLREKPWDMFFVTFGEPHPAGHYLWHLEDASYPAHPAEGNPALAHAVRDVYVAVDTAIGDILDGLDDDVTVIITSGDGMGPNYAGCHFMPEILHRLGVFYAAGVGTSPDGAATPGRPKKSVLSTIRDAIPLSVRRSVARCLPRHLNHRLSMKWANANIDWARTRAFCLPNANEGYVRLNLRGREPQGIVESGAAYTELLAELQERLQELVHPHTGKLAAQQVVCTDAVFPGEKRQNLPDLVVNWSLEARILADLASDRCGIVHKEAGYQTAPYYTGNHRPSAFVLARGPRLSANVEFTDGHIVDVAPTLLTMLGVEPPQHMDGRVWGPFTGQPSPSIRPH